MLFLTCICRVNIQKALAHEIVLFAKWKNRFDTTAATTTILRDFATFLFI